MGRSRTNSGRKGAAEGCLEARDNRQGCLGLSSLGGCLGLVLRRGLAGLGSCSEDKGFKASKSPGQWEARHSHREALSLGSPEVFRQEEARRYLGAKARCKRRRIRLSCSQQRRLRSAGLRGSRPAVRLERRRRDRAEVFLGGSLGLRGNLPIRLAQALCRAHLCRGCPRCSHREVQGWREWARPAGLGVLNGGRGQPEQQGWALLHSKEWETAGQR